MSKHVLEGAGRRAPEQTVLLVGFFCHELETFAATVLVTRPVVQCGSRDVEGGPRPGWHVRDVTTGFVRTALLQHVRH